MGQRGTAWIDLVALAMIVRMSDMQKMWPQFKLKGTQQRTLGLMDLHHRCKVTSKMRAYQATQRLGRSYNTKTKEYNN